MKITLIEPAMIKTKRFGEKPQFMLQPLTLATLAGLTPPDVEVQAIDDRIESINYDEARDLVGISLKTYTARRAYQIAAEFRQRGVPVIFGGHHATLLPQEAGQWADSILLGEAEGIWADVVRDLRRGRLQKVYGRAETLPLAHITPDRSVFAGKKYLPVAMIETTRGCPFACSFCSVTTFFGRGFRHRPPSEVVAEVLKLNQKLYFFVDDNIVADRAAARELCKALIPLKIRWISQASLTMAKDLELMRLMRESGCVGVLIGIESINRTNLKQINKGWNTVGFGYDEALKIIREHGIAVVGSFILGMDDDTPEGLELTLEFAVKQKFFTALFNLLTPYPGTKLYEEFERGQRLLKPVWWLDPTYTYSAAVFRPKRMSIEALEQGRLHLYREFYSARSIASRLWERSANASDLWRAFTFLSMNMTANKEEAMRTGQALGEHEAAWIDGAPAEQRAGG